VRVRSNAGEAHQFAISQKLESGGVIFVVICLFIKVVFGENVVGEILLILLDLFKLKF
jgi:hypothetical protein